MQVNPNTEDMKQKIRLLDSEKKWLEVQDYYQSHYRVRFKVKLDDETVMFLWNKMRKLQQELRDYEFFRGQKR